MLIDLTYQRQRRAACEPAVSPSTIMTCDGKNFVGWPCDEKEEDLRQQYIQETDPGKAEGVGRGHAPAFVGSDPLCPARAAQAAVSVAQKHLGVLKANTLVFWNIEKD